MLDAKQKKALIDAAILARKSSYSPYSSYRVGAALLTESGEIYQGTNIENAAYPMSICAERVAAFKAISAEDRDFLAIAVVTRDGGFPCGACRQVLSEFGLGAEVIIADDEGTILEESSVSDLLPGAFGPSNLKST
jgi:cytidine deaminase